VCVRACPRLRVGQLTLYGRAGGLARLGAKTRALQDALA